MIYAHTGFLNYVNFFNKKRFLNLNKKNLDFYLQKMLLDLRNISKNNLIIPTYNYDFGRKKIFNVEKDISHVGSFSEFFRKKFIKNRTKIPFFSSCSIKKRKLLSGNKLDVFGKNSEFSFLIKQKGNIINFGSQFAPTFIIFIESNLPGGILYRYTKKFEGIIENKKKKEKIIIYYQVRPLNINITYDLNKIKLNLIKEKILINKNTSEGFPYQQYNAKDFYEFSMKKLKKDSLYFLDTSTKKILHKKNLLKKGRLKLKDFE
jgi:aminoglycoside N3'-acetyltransferase